MHVLALGLLGYGLYKLVTANTVATEKDPNKGGGGNVSAANDGINNPITSNITDRGTAKKFSMADKYFFHSVANKSQPHGTPLVNSHNKGTTSSVYEQPASRS